MDGGCVWLCEGKKLYNNKERKKDLFEKNSESGKNQKESICWILSTCVSYVRSDV